jgi:hypothetical protein
MTHTHVSHYGLTQVATTPDDRILFNGTLGNVRRMAFAHGYEVTKTNYYTVGKQGGVVAYSAEVSGYELTTNDGKTALIIAARDGWDLMMDRTVWNREK